MNTHAVTEIKNALKTNKRVKMVQTLQKLSGEEFETCDEVWSIAEENKKQIRNRLHDLLDYYIDQN